MIKDIIYLLISYYSKTAKHNTARNA